MKIHDLMIGDFVLYNDDLCIVDEIRVDNMAVLTALNTDVTSIDGDQVSVDEITPVPLIAEILEKNGLELDRGWDNDNEYFFPNHFKEDVDASLEISMDNGKIYWSISCDEYHIIEIKYVHELQHALRLCGINKEITIL